MLSRLELDVLIHAVLCNSSCAAVARPISSGSGRWQVRSHLNIRHHECHMRIEIFEEFITTGNISKKFRKKFAGNDKKLLDCKMESRIEVQNPVIVSSDGNQNVANRYYQLQLHNLSGQATVMDFS